MNTFKRSMALLESGRRAMKINKSLMYYPVISLIATIIMIAIMVGVGISATTSLPSFDFEHSWITWLLFIIFYLVAQFIGIFVNSAFFLAAEAALQGEKTTIKKTFHITWTLRKEIAAWALLTGTVGIILRAIEEKVDFIGKLVVSFFGLAWSLATIFAIPTMVRHRTKPIQTVKDSAKLFTKTWGENVVVEFSLGMVSAFSFLVLVSASIFTGSLFFAIFTIPILAYIFWSVLVIAFLWFLFYLSAIETVFRAALFRYAETGDYIGPFSKEMIDNAFKPKVKNKKFLFFKLAPAKK
ncbi:MAG TPA: DUF6159 family protein [Patescibacteria group bacterium]|nr:DUF6159 family protein [Patescibacteria group bacterium]